MIRPLRARAGFTMIELTLVTVIILALVALSVPLFKKTFSDLAAKDTAFNISKFVSYAREKSVIGRKNYKVIFDFNRRQYQLFESSQSADGLVYTKTKDRFGKAFTLPGDLSFYDPKTGLTGKPGEEYKKQIVFYPDGHCDELAIDIMDRSGAGYSITLKGFGGLARIKEVAHEPR